MEKWRGKVAIVTGASSGIGKAISLKLVSHGITVVGCSRNFDNLLNVVNEFPEKCKHLFIPFQCDVSKEDNVLKMFNYVKIEFGSLSILINNAGLASNGSILHGKTEDWEKIFGTNTLSVCMFTREAFSLMEKNENNQEVPGHIININSTFGHIIPSMSYAHFYSCMKHAMTAITECVRLELREAKSNVRVTQISPGFVETNMIEKLKSEKIIIDYLRSAIPEFLESDDVADAVIFALSTEPRSSVHDINLRPTCQPF